MKEKGMEISDGRSAVGRADGRTEERDWRSCSSAPAAKISYTHHGVAHRHCRAGSCRRSLRAKVAVPAWCRPRPPSSAPSVLAKYGYRFRAQFNTKWKIGPSASQRPTAATEKAKCGIVAWSPTKRRRNARSVRKGLETALFCRTLYCGPTTREPSERRQSTQISFPPLCRETERLRKGGEKRRRGGGPSLLRLLNVLNKYDGLMRIGVERGARMAFKRYSQTLYNCITLDGINTLRLTP